MSFRVKKRVGSHFSLSSSVCRYVFQSVKWWRVVKVKEEGWLVGPFKKNENSNKNIKLIGK